MLISIMRFSKFSHATYMKTKFTCIEVTSRIGEQNMLHKFLERVTAMIYIKMQNGR